MSVKSAVITRSKAKKQLEMSGQSDEIAEISMPRDTISRPPQDAQHTRTTPPTPLPRTSLSRQSKNDEPARETQSQCSRSARISSKDGQSANARRKKEKLELENKIKMLRKQQYLIDLEMELSDRLKGMHNSTVSQNEEDSDDNESERYSRTEEWVDTVSRHSSYGGDPAYRDANALKQVPTSIAQTYTHENSATAVNRESNASRDVIDLSAPTALDSARVYNKVIVRRELSVSRDVSPSERRVGNGPRKHVAWPTHGEPAATESEPLSRPAGNVLAATKPAFREPDLQLITPDPVVMHEKESGQLNGEGMRREASTEVRDLKISQRTLEEALINLSRPMPRQAYELQPFDGDPGDWISFKNAFEETTSMYGYKAHENLARLRSALKGEAKDAVEDLLRTAIDPFEIMRVLENEFGHPTELLQCALRKIRKLPTMTESGREIKKFSTAVRNCVSLLKHIRAEGYINNPQIFGELLGKLTPTQRAQYGDFALKMDNKPGVDLRISPSLEILSKFLEQLSQAASYYVHADINISTTVPVKHHAEYRRHIKPSRQRQVHHVNVQSDAIEEFRRENGCVLCDMNHSLEKCKKFMIRNVARRYDVLKRFKRCYQCLHQGHYRRACQAQQCEKCGLSHHVLLHIDNNGKVEEATESVTNLGQPHAKSLLKVTPVTIQDINGERKNIVCYALLDDGATVSLVDSSLTDNVPGGRAVPLVIRSARGHETSDSKSRVVTLNIKGPNGQCHKVQCRTIRELNLPSQTVPVAVMKENAHLRNLGCEEMHGAKPLLLLGQDNWEFLVSEEIRRGKSGKPVASLTKLGWVVHGPMMENAIDQSSSELVNCMATLLPDRHDIVKTQFESVALGITEDPQKHGDVGKTEEIVDVTSQSTPDGYGCEVSLLRMHDSPYIYKQIDSESLDRRSDNKGAYLESEKYVSSVAEVELGERSSVSGDGYTPGKGDAERRYGVVHGTDSDHVDVPDGGTLGYNAHAEFDDITDSPTSQKDGQKIVTTEDAALDIGKHRIETVKQNLDSDRFTHDLTIEKVQRATRKTCHFDANKFVRHHKYNGDSEVNNARAAAFRQVSLHADSEWEIAIANRHKSACLFVLTDTRSDKIDFFPDIGLKNPNNQRSDDSDWHRLPSTEIQADDTTGLFLPNNCSKRFTGSLLLCNPQIRRTSRAVINATGKEADRARRAATTTCAAGPPVRIESHRSTQACMKTAPLRPRRILMPVVTDTGQAECGKLRPPRDVIGAAVGVELSQREPATLRTQLRDFDPGLGYNLLRRGTEPLADEKVTGNERHPTFTDRRYLLNTAALLYKQGDADSGGKEQHWSINRQTTNGSSECYMNHYVMEDFIRTSSDYRQQRVLPEGPAHRAPRSSGANTPLDSATTKPVDLMWATRASE